MNDPARKAGFIIVNGKNRTKDVRQKYDRQHCSLVLKPNHIHFVSSCDEADTFIVQHDFMHLSFFKDDFREFVDTLVVALRQMKNGS